jgi:hypothetical protein
MRSEWLRIAREEGLYALDQQGQRLNDLRGRAFAIVGGGAAAAGFLTPAALEDDDFRAIVVLGLVAFIIATAAALFVVYPRSWKLTRDSRDLAAMTPDAVTPERLEELLAKSAAWLTDDYETNEKRMAPIWTAAQVAIAATGAEVALLTIAVIAGS